MSELYENISMLLREKGVSGYKMCKDIGIRPSILSDLKSGRKQGLHTETAEKIANYFDVSVNYLVNAKEWDKVIEKQNEGGENSYASGMIAHGFVRNPDYRKDGYAWKREDQKEKSPTPEGMELSEKRIKEMLKDMTVSDLESLLSDVAVELAKKRGTT